MKESKERFIIRDKKGPNNQELKPPFRLETREGSVIVYSMGKLICKPPFTSRDRTYPVGFQSVRSFFDIANPSVVSKYVSEISDFGDRPIFSVTPMNHPEERVVCLTPHDCWKAIAEIISRNSAGNITIKNIDGLDMFGLSYLTSMTKDMIISEYRTLIRPPGWVAPTWYQSKPKRKRRANSKYLESPTKRAKKNDSDSDFDLIDENEATKSHYPSLNSSNSNNNSSNNNSYNNSNNNNNNSDDTEIEGSLFGIFATLSDYLSKKKR